jgi:hypothetical protein
MALIAALTFRTNIFLYNKLLGRKPPHAADGGIFTALQWVRFTVPLALAGTRLEIDMVRLL